MPPRAPLVPAPVRRTYAGDRQPPRRRPDRWPGDGRRTRSPGAPNPSSISSDSRAGVVSRWSLSLATGMPLSRGVSRGARAMNWCGFAARVGLMLEVVLEAVLVPAMPNSMISRRIWRSTGPDVCSWSRSVRSRLYGYGLWVQRSAPVLVVERGGGVSAPRSSRRRGCRAAPLRGAARVLRRGRHGGAGRRAVRLRAARRGGDGP